MRFRGVALTGACAASLGLGLLCVPTSALALSVTGNDCYALVQSGTSIDVLSVDGSVGDTVYCSVTKDGRLFADHLAYTLSNDGLASSDGGVTGIVSADFGAIDPSASYEISAYSDFDEHALLYRGRVEPVYAELDGVAGKRLIAWRTIGSEQRAFAAPKTISYGSDTYELDGGCAASSVYRYKVQNDGHEAESGSITYVDDSGERLLVQGIGDVAWGEHRSVEVPQIIKADNGGYYRTVFFNKTLDAANPGQRDFTVRCKKVSDGLAGKQGFYTAKIRMVDEQGNVLACDSVSVAGDVIYANPPALYKDADRDGVIEAYELDGDATLSLAPGDEGVQDGQRSFDVRYRRVQGKTYWQIVKIDATQEGSGRVLGMERVEVGPSNGASCPASYYADNMDVDGKTWSPVNGSDFSYVWGQSGPVTYVYYAPRGTKVDRSDRAVTVRYVDVATGEQIGEDNRTLSADMREDVVIDTPASLTVGPKSYVRLDGQEGGVRTGYYTPGSTYTVYYRDVNDSASQRTVITNVLFDFVPGRTTYVDLGTERDGTREDTSDQRSASLRDAVTTGVPAGQQLSTVDNGFGEPTIVNGEGDDLNTVRIDDNETPLASGGAGTWAAETPLWEKCLAAIAGAAALALVIVAVLRRRRRRAEDDGADGREVH